MSRALALLALSSLLLVTAWPATAQGQTADVPAKPTGLTGTITHASVSLTWDDPDDDSITGYQVLRRDRAVHETGEFAVLVDDTNSPATSYADTDVEAEGRYVYRVKARNAAGLSPQSSYFDANLPAAPAPSTPISRRRLPLRRQSPGGACPFGADGIDRNGQPRFRLSHLGRPGR